MAFSGADVVVGRVVSEDDDYMLLELAKQDVNGFLTSAVPGNNQFFTLLFVKFEGGVPVCWKPWMHA